MRHSLPLVLAAMLTLPAAAQAQVQDPVEACLCARQHLDTTRGQWDAAQRHYREAEARLDGVKEEAEQLRTTMTPGDEAAIDRLKQLLAEQDRLTAEFFNVEMPHYQSVIDRYNRSIAGYDAHCTGRRFDPAAMAAAQTRLVCPAE